MDLLPPCVLHFTLTKQSPLYTTGEIYIQKFLAISQCSLVKSYTSVHDYLPHQINAS